MSREFVELSSSFSFANIGSFSFALYFKRVRRVTLSTLSLKMKRKESEVPEHSWRRQRFAAQRLRKDFPFAVACVVANRTVPVSRCASGCHRLPHSRILENCPSLTKALFSFFSTHCILPLSSFTTFYIIGSPLVAPSLLLSFVGGEFFLFQTRF